MQSTPEKKPLQTAIKQRPHTVDVEVAAFPDAMESIDVLEIIFSGSGKFDEEAKKWADEVLAREINTQALHADDFCEAAVENSKSALLYAWACGILLNTAKARFGHGRFGKWRKQILNEKVICERTSQRYMLLATTFPDVEVLLMGASSLRQAQLACSQSSEMKNIDEIDAGSMKKKKQSFLSSVTGYRKTLGRFAAIKGHLGEEEKQQLRRAKAEIDEFFGAILG